MTEKLFPLANSIWPRSGGDRGNRAHANIAGPSLGKIVKKIALPYDGVSINNLIRGVVVAQDGTLRTINNGSLTALTLEGEILWSVALAQYNEVADHDDDYDDDDDDDYDDDDDDDYDDDDDDDDYGEQDFEDAHVSKILRKHTENDDLIDDRYVFHSIPIALANGCTLVILRNAMVMFDQKGQLVYQIDMPGLSPDDSGLSPNITYSDELILTSTQGAAYLFGFETVQELGVFGYDIRPVAMFDDNTFLISGYSQLGICRVTLEGQLIWDTGLKDADLLPVVNSRQFSALGSFNEEFSAIYTPRGELYGRYNRPAIFAEYLNGEWIAFSESHVARLQSNGKVIWEHEIDAVGMLLRHQPIVDKDGIIYLVDNEFLMSFNSEGKRLLKLKVGGSVGPLSFVKEAMIGYVKDDKLILLE